jgi:hypothetical protein
MPIQMRSCSLGNKNHLSNMGLARAGLVGAIGVRHSNYRAKEHTLAYMRQSAPRPLGTATNCCVSDSVC